MGPLLAPIVITGAVLYGLYRNRQANAEANGGRVVPFPPGPLPFPIPNGGGGAKPAPAPANPRGVVPGSVITVDVQAVPLGDVAAAAGGAAGAAMVAAVVLRADQVTAANVEGPWLGFLLTNGTFQKSTGPRQVVATSAIGNVYPVGTDLFS